MHSMNWSEAAICREFPWHFDKRDPLPCERRIRKGNRKRRGFLNVWLGQGISGVNVTFAWYSRLTILCLHLSNWARIFPLLFIFTCKTDTDNTTRYTKMSHKIRNTSVDVLDSYQTNIKRACNDRLLKNNQWLRQLCKHEWGGTCCIACLFRLAFRSSNAYSFILFPYQKPNIFLTHDLQFAYSTSNLKNWIWNPFKYFVTLLSWFQVSNFHFFATS